MLFRAPVIVLAALLAQSALAIDDCPAGSYLKHDNHEHTCTVCPAGQYTSTSNIMTSCDKCPAGQEPNLNHTGCDKCPKGQFNPIAGRRCKKCPAGKFNSVLGAKSCCDCCAGWYSNSKGSTSCKKCKDSPKDCNQANDSLPNLTTSCDMVADNVCPNPTGGEPQGTAVTRKRRHVHCANGLDACPRYSGRGGFDCVDPKNDPESCGGCTGPDGEGTGTDCTALEGVSVTRCVKGSCVIDSCRKRWIKSLDSTSCDLPPHKIGHPKHNSLYTGGTNEKKTQMRSSAKRAFRANIY